MSRLTPLVLAVSAALAFSIVPSAAQTNTTTPTPCTNCGGGTKIDNTINIDFSHLAKTLDKVIEALTALGLKPSVNNGTIIFNNGGVINYGNYNSGTMNNSLQNSGVYNSGTMTNNKIKLLSGVTLVGNDFNFGNKGGSGGGGGGGGGGHGGGGSGGGGSGGGWGNGFKACGNGAVCGRRW